MNNEIWEEFNSRYKARKSDQTVIVDGKICEKKYDIAPIKLLFVLKEVNDWKGQDCDEQFFDFSQLFCQHKEKDLLCPKGLIWHNVARIAAGIMNCNDGQYPTIENIDIYDTKCESLSSVAAINLKKISGHLTSNADEINTYTVADKDLLRQQIKCLQPDIIIAGGTISPLLWLLNVDLEFSIEKPWEKPWEKPIFISEEQLWVVPYKHPSARGRKDEYYNKFFDIVDNVKDLKMFINNNVIML